MNRLKRTIGLTMTALLAATVGAAMFVSVAAAQAPPNPPARFVGSVTIDGTPAPSGTLVEARIGNAACGSASVFIANNESRYALDSPALDPATSPGCGTEASTVEFYVGGKKASQTAGWANFQLNTVNLTVAAATPTTTSPTVTATPGAPVTGTGPATGSSSAMPLMGLMLVAAALGLGGVGIAARVRNR